MIDALITSKTRIKLLMKFFLNPETSAHLRGLEDEFGESTNGIRIELNRLEEAGMLISDQVGQRKLFRVCTTHPLYADIHNIVIKYLGLDKIVERVVEGLGGVQQVFLVGAMANGQESATLEVALIGHVNEHFLAQVIEKGEALISRKILPLCFETLVDFQALYAGKPHLMLWQKEK